MTVVVFTGPTLAAAEGARLLPDAIFLPPAGPGDLYRAARQAPQAIGLIDGASDPRLAVGPEEILWALARGIAVYGAAGTGALRAVELAPFGMRGVGTVFEWFRDGHLEADDEVAGAPAPVVALVNVRATCSEAVAEAVFSRDDAAAVLSGARRLFHPHRTWPAILEQAVVSAPTPTPGGMAAFERWLGEGFGRAVDVKAEDACHLLEVMGADRAQGFPAPGPPPAFELPRTEAWLELERQVERTDPGPDRVEDGARLLSELERDDPDALPGVLREATERALGLLLPHPAPDEAEVEAATSAFRRAQGLTSEEDAAAWMARAGLDDAAFRRLMKEEARLAAAARPTRQAILRQVPSVVRRRQP